MSLLNKILDKILGKNILYYPGCFTKNVIPNIEKNYEQILKQLGIDFIKLKDVEYCCGSPIMRAGMRADFEDIKAKNIAVFKQFNVGLIITNCPACYNMLKFEYKLSEHNINIEHITQTIARKNKNKKTASIKVSADNNIFYHDPCHLGRLSDVYNEPREILNNNGYSVCELSRNKENSMCCGGGGGLVNNNPDLSKKIAKDVLTEITENSSLTSPCPMCYYQFKQNAGEGVDVKEFSEIILNNK